MTAHTLLNHSLQGCKSVDLRDALTDAAALFMMIKSQNQHLSTNRGTKEERVAHIHVGIGSSIRMNLYHFRKVDTTGDFHFKVI